ncbi:transmembrane amino acid transporter [Hamiltosporidium tvaerminnensis]|uniref:Transmembrane amino acid transporter n=1 Tax=Hamiltosporidium tvaerminnensis TaxID=1176355 RepID=A0A4Q9LWZ5_9MICR|nr:hypothetical protein LUQ84_001424 [Hamiltosporidium tvaerminnensis]TBU02296.1 transmembrane amino acid transporter [Hamiltosporidium tvaerminnensis]TBU13289.1 transmembrane amino acid transporter [Hamiltosporidium tvaerminnensis]
MSNKSGLSVFSGTSVMITTMLGSGVILLPRAFKDLGYIIGSLTFLGIAAITFFTLFTLCSAAFQTEKKGNYSYFGTCQSISPILAYAADSCIALQGYACCLVYLIALKGWLPKVFGLQTDGIIVVGVVIIPLFILSSLKSLKKLWFTSYVSVGSVLFLSFLIIFYCIKLGGYEMKASGFGFGSAISVMVFALGCHQNILKVFNELEKCDLKEIVKVSLFSVIGGSVIYIGIGLTGYYLVGDLKMSILEEMLEGEVSDKINGLTGGGMLVKGAVLGFCFVMMCAFPMQVQPARDSILNLIGKIFKKEKISESARMISTVVFVLSIGGLACIKKLEYGFVLNIVGATCTTFITFLFPSLVYALGKNGNGILRILAGGVSLLSAILSCFMLYQVIKG